MPRRCAIRGCNSHMMAGSTYISTFKFPDCEETKKQWIAATCRPNWYPSKYSGICSSHFKKEDLTYYMFDKDSKRLRLHKGAIPTIFTTVMPTTRIRIEPLTMRGESRAPTAPSDYIGGNFEMFTKQYREKLDISNYLIFQNAEKVVFYKLKSSNDLGCNISTRICISNNLYLKVIVNNTEIFSASLELLPRNMKISNWSQVAFVLNKYRYEEPTENVETRETREYLVNRALHYLEQIRDVEEDFAHFGKLDIIINQVEIFNRTKPRYHPETILFAFLIYAHSAATYNILKKFFILPHPSYLKVIFDSNDMTDCQRNDDNLKKDATDKEKFVALVIDEIRIENGLELINNKTGDSCVIVFTIKSIFGKFKKIVRFVPTVRPDDEMLHKLTKSVIHYVQNNDFKVLAIIIDSSKVNQDRFRKFCSNNNFFINPDFPELKIYYLFDTINLFRSIRNNWFDLKNYNKTFFYPDFTDYSVKKATFSNFELLISKTNDPLCKIPKPYKLDKKTVSPKVVDRHNITLIDNLFHDSTISALYQYDEMKETADFCAIIRKWWDIVNTKTTIKGVFQIKSLNGENYTFLEKFLAWIEVWRSSPNNSGSLSECTLNGLKLTTQTFLDLVKFSFLSSCKAEHVELRNLQSEDFEGRFSLSCLQ